MKRQLIASAAAMFCASALVAAQAPGQQPPSQPSTPSRTSPPQPRSDSQTETRSATQAATMTVTGCVFREADVPGRTPNVAERAGVLEDYILADVRTSSDSGATGTTGSATGTTGGGAGREPDAAGREPRAAGREPGDVQPGQRPGSAATTGSAAAMYKLERADDDKLQDLVGKRVEVVGRIDAERGDTGRPGAAGQDDRSSEPDRSELPAFEVTSIREIAGTCPPTPPAR